MSAITYAGPGTDEPVVWYEGSGTTDRRWLHADERGSVIAVSDQTSIVGINSYDAYGKPSSGNLGRFGYTGQAWLPELGMWYYKARIYNPANNVARFMQGDPIGYGSGMNIYAYVAGDPVNLVDPSGLEGEDIEVIACGGAKVDSDGNCGSGGDGNSGIGNVQSSGGTPASGASGGGKAKPKPKPVPKPKPKPKPKTVTLCDEAKVCVTVAKEGMCEGGKAITKAGIGVAAAAGLGSRASQSRAFGSGRIARIGGSLGSDITLAALLAAFFGAIQQGIYCDGK